MVLVHLRHLRLIGEQLSLGINSTLRQRSDLVVEQLLSLLPDTNVLPVLKAKQTRQQSRAESLGSLAGKQAREVVDADDAEGQAVAALGQGHGDRRVGEGGVDVVDGDGVVGVSSVAGDIADDAEATRLRGERLGVDEGGDLGRQVDAVNEHVGLNDLLVRAGLGRGLGEIPFLEAIMLVATFDD